jgi:hypothetical protein
MSMTTINIASSLSPTLALHFKTSSHDHRPPFLPARQAPL